MGTHGLERETITPTPHFGGVHREHLRERDKMKADQKALDAAMLALVKLRDRFAAIGDREDGRLDGDHHLDQGTYEDVNSMTGELNNLIRDYWHVCQDDQVSKKVENAA